VLPVAAHRWVSTDNRKLEKDFNILELQHVEDNSAADALSMRAPT
jgi:hypothetical protein